MNDLLSLIQAGEDQSYDLNPKAPSLARGRSERSQAQQQFLQKLEEVEADLALIRVKHREIEQMNEQSKVIVQQDKVHQQRDMMQAAISQVNTIAFRVSRMIQDMEKMNQEALQLPKQGPGSASERIRTSNTAAVKAKFRDLMGMFSDLRQRIQAEYKEVVQRRIYTVTGQQLQEEEVERIIEAGEGEQIFQRAIQEQGRGKVLDTLAEIKERHGAMKDLEASLLQLHQIFIEMAVQVDAQGEKLNHIGEQVSRAKDHVEIGVLDLGKAVEYKKSANKKVCYIVTFVIVLILVLSIVLYLNFR